jgi:hypothetical protein
MEIVQDNHSGQAPIIPPAATFAVTHCQRCAAGWTRGKSGGVVVTVCLLDREPVLPGMTSCDRFQGKEEAVFGKAVAQAQV